MRRIVDRKWGLPAVAGLLLVLLGGCSANKTSLKEQRDRLARQNDAPPPPPVTLTLFRVTSSGKELEAHRNALLISDTTLRAKVQNRTGKSLYLKVEQQANAEGVVPLDPPDANSSVSEKDSGLYKLDSNETLAVDFPVHHGLREGRVTLRLWGDSSGEKSYAQAQATFRSRPALAYYGDDELPFKTDNDGMPLFELDRKGASGLQQRNFFVEMIPGPADGATCDIALESVTDDGTKVSMVEATLGPPAYRDGPFHAVAGAEVLPTAHRYRRDDLVAGDPSEEPSSPAPRDPTDLIAAGQIQVRRIDCH